MAVSDIRNFVYRVIDIFPGPLKTPARWVADRIFGIWNEIFEHLSIFRPAWNYLQAKLADLAWTAQNFALEVARTVRWLVVTALPRWANWALTTALRVLRAEAAALFNRVHGLLDQAVKYLHDLLSSLWGKVNSLTGWARERVNELFGLLNSLRDMVRRFLTSPEVLVDWLFAALWRRFWRFLNDHAEAIANSAWNRKDAIIAQALRRLEDWILRVL